MQGLREEGVDAIGGFDEAAFEDDDVVGASTLRDEIECGEDFNCACAACAAEAVSL